MYHKVLLENSQCHINSTDNSNNYSLKFFNNFKRHLNVKMLFGLSNNGFRLQ
jgi:hypothetical protein